MLMAILFSGCDSIKESTKKHSPQDTAVYTDDQLVVKISYSRPYKKDRQIFGAADEDVLVPYGEIWRTGANEATQITLNEDIELGGKPLPAGTYSLYTIPGPEEWIIAINEKTDYWGKSLFGSPYDADLDVMRIVAPVFESQDEMEQFTIDFTEDEQRSYIRFMWDHVTVMIPFRP